MLDTAAAELVRSHADGVIIQNAAGEVIDHNPAAAALLEMTPDQLIGATSSDPTWQAVDSHGEPLAGDQHPAMRVLATGSSVPRFDMGVRTGRGAWRWLRIGSWPIDLDGQRGAITQFADVTGEVESRRLLSTAIERLQEHVVPAENPVIEHLDVHVRYRNVVEPLQIGGDFCDIYPIGDDRHAFFIGDACGHDLDTIATTMVAHHTLRAAGLHLTRPARVLRWLDDTLDATPDTVYCSAIHGLLRRMPDGEFTVELANAGHPRPVLLRADGSVVEIETSGHIVGAGLRFIEPESVTFTMRVDEQLVLYTDGLLEGHSPRLTVEDLIDRLTTARREGRPAIAVVDELVDTADSPLNRDDTTAMVLRVTS